jgi:hypothetical protein
MDEKDLNIAQASVMLDRVGKIVDPMVSEAGREFMTVIEESRFI